MSKGSNLENGFLILYDWLPALQDLDGESLKELLLALIERQRSGTEFPKFDNRQVYIYAKMIEPTIKRRLYGQEGGNKGKVGTTIVPTKDTTIVPTEPSRAKQSRDKISEAKNTPIPPDGADAMTKRFDAFWKEYPRKIGKQAAQKIYMKVKPDHNLSERMIKAVQEQRQSEQWKKEGGRFIPNPATWLNRGQWDDVIEITETKETQTSRKKDLDDLF